MKPTLIVLAAGMGSRYGGLKQVDGLGPNGETIIDYSVFDAVRAGFGKIIFVIRRDIESDFMQAFANRFAPDVDFELAYQELDMLPQGVTVPAGRVKPWGTAHAVWVARRQVKGPFAVINADDFYGRGAFDVLAKALSTPSLGAGNYFMVGYEVGKTLSEQGGVSRGVCCVNAQHELSDVVERFGIERNVDGNICYVDGDKRVAIADKTPVSMNFWGFTPDFIELTERLMADFFGGVVDNAKAEFYIPYVVNHAIKHGLASCKMLTTDAQWFGVTYPGDRAMVVERLKALADCGEYPSPLWSSKRGA
ncbi:MAG: nucleotidyltransferase [Bacteroidales bacterium]|nr:nucleotidyltransferase [Bacteroidales bacterium]